MNFLLFLLVALKRVGQLQRNTHACLQAGKQPCNCLPSRMLQRWCMRMNDSTDSMDHPAMSAGQTAVSSAPAREVRTSAGHGDSITESRFSGADFFRMLIGWFRSSPFIAHNADQGRSGRHRNPFALLIKERQRWCRRWAPCRIATTATCRFPRPEAAEAVLRTPMARSRVVAARSEGRVAEPPTRRDRARWPPRWRPIRR